MMKKKMILKLSMLAALLALLWGCRTEDLVKPEKDPQRNNAEFFRHSASASAKNSKDYISILEEYHKKNDFLSLMPDQKGMPIWEKMYVVETEKASCLMIPLSYNDETMSSILFVTLDGQNRVTGVKNIDNAILKSVVYNQRISKEAREQFFLNFMLMDNRTFGNEHFAGIPKDLFVGDKSDDRYGTMRLKDFKPSDAVTTQQAGKLFIGMVCVTVVHCTHHGSGACDACSACQTTTCTPTIMGTADDPFPTNPGGGGGGSGGGSIPVGPDLPENPCRSQVSSVFYRPAPGCGDGTYTNPDNPCNKARASITKANAVLHSTAGQTMDAALKGKAGAQNEWAAALGQYPDNTYQATAPVEGAQHSSNVPVGLLNSTNIGDGHSHSGNSAAPSAGDLYGMLEMAATNPKFKYRFVYGISGSSIESYALVLNSQTAAIAFLAAYPRSENYDPETHGFLENSNLWNEIEKMKIIYNNKSTALDTSGETYEPRVVGLAYIFEKVNAGINIAKLDTNGNLKKINATIEKIPNDERAKISKCP
ncbi:hypothetical protein [Chryseobacterium vrystaatense]|uniref:Uncharacterized protein n=1 Tax=Chryseobacterium vrystaatense TaxID=307480 RepID=A0A1M5IB59_9FLAO|nr:hypothetical protein [Chryseobacterium vrystaatense]SHG25023.1 hypothetical protein SAMN02787073_3793 [Chryseobacterium vrystaatense]